MQPPSRPTRSVPPRPTASLKLIAAARARRGLPLSTRQVAALLGLRQQTVHAAERRALAKLRRALSDLLPTPPRRIVLAPRCRIR